MSVDHPPPFTRPFPLGRVAPTGSQATVEATEAERAAVASALDLPTIRALAGRFTVAGNAERVRVTGRVQADLDQVCVVSLEPFPTEVDEAVDVAFVSPVAGDVPGAEVEADLDRPDELVGDTIDLGAIAVEFLALGLDPYPRKPGASFAAAEEERAPTGAFAALSALRRDPPAEG